MPEPVHPPQPASTASALARRDEPRAAPLRSVSRHFSALARWLSFFTQSTETRNAGATCLQLLDLYWAVAAQHPDLKGRELYRQILRVHAGGDERAADRALGEAEQSFASWPAPRELAFRDVVNYLALSDFLVAHPEEHWTHSDLRRAVAARIPRDL